MIKSEAFYQEISSFRLLVATAEHYFQAMKFKDNKEYFEKIRLSALPSIAFKLGRTRDIKICKDWESIKDDVMLQALRAKFAQHDNLKKLLLSTNKRLIIEHTKNDRYWADGGDGSGKNILGKLLMQVRSELS